MSRKTITHGFSPGEEVLGAIIKRVLSTSGGMSVTYLAADRSSGERVVVKVPTAKELSRPSARSDFRREAELLMRISSKSVAAGLRFGEEGGVPILIMEYCPGDLLENCIHRWRKHCQFHLGEALGLLIRVARGLNVIHGSGVIHGDVAAQNIIIQEEGQRTIKYIDFGSAVGIDSSLRASGKPDDQTTEGLTIPCRPNYASPELLENGERTIASDIYALGVLFYRVLSGGRFPVAPRDGEKLARAQRHSRVTPLGESISIIPPDLDTLVGTMLAKDPGLRPRSADEIASRLQVIVSQPTVSLDGKLWSTVRLGKTKAGMVPVAIVGSAAIIVVMVTVFLLFSHTLKGFFLSKSERATHGSSTISLKSEPVPIRREERSAEAKPQERNQPVFVRHLGDFEIRANSPTLQGAPVVPNVPNSGPLLEQEIDEPGGRSSHGHGLGGLWAQLRQRLRPSKRAGSSRPVAYRQSAADIARSGTIEAVSMDQIDATSSRSDESESLPARQVAETEQLVTPPEIETDEYSAGQIETPIGEPQNARSYDPEGTPEALSMHAEISVDQIDLADERDRGFGDRVTALLDRYAAREPRLEDVDHQPTWEPNPLVELKLRANTGAVESDEVRLDAEPTVEDPQRTLGIRDRIKSLLARNKRESPSIEEATRLPSLTRDRPESAGLSLVEGARQSETGKKRTESAGESNVGLGNRVAVLMERYGRRRQPDEEDQEPFRDSLVHEVESYSMPSSGALQTDHPASLVGLSEEPPSGLGTRVKGLMDRLSRREPADEDGNASSVVAAIGAGAIDSEPATEYWQAAGAITPIEPVEASSPEASGEDGIWVDRYQNGQTRAIETSSSPPRTARVDPVAGGLIVREQQVDRFPDVERPGLEELASLASEESEHQNEREDLQDVYVVNAGIGERNESIAHLPAQIEPRTEDGSREALGSEANRQNVAEPINVLMQQRRFDEAQELLQDDDDLQTRGFIADQLSTQWQQQFTIAKKRGDARAMEMAAEKFAVEGNAMTAAEMFVQAADAYERRNLLPLARSAAGKAIDCGASGEVLRRANQILTRIEVRERAARE